jgi:hypothetical protein
VAGDPEPTLHDLSRRVPTPEELKAFFDSVKDMENRAVALILSSLTDNLLEACIAMRFVRLGKKRFDKMFREQGAPLGTFSAKIATGFALGIINSELRSQLDRIRHIRNAFAHAMLVVSFDEPMIAQACNKLDHNRLIPGIFTLHEDTPRSRFTMAATFAMFMLLFEVQRRGTELRYGANPWRSEPLDKFALRLLRPSQNPG